MTKVIQKTDSEERRFGFSLITVLNARQLNIRLKSNVHKQRLLIAA